MISIEIYLVHLQLKQIFSKKRHQFFAIPLNFHINKNKRDKRRLSLTLLRRRGHRLYSTVSRIGSGNPNGMFVFRSAHCLFSERINQPTYMTTKQCAGTFGLISMDFCIQVHGLLYISPCTFGRMSTYCCTKVQHFAENVHVLRGKSAWTLLQKYTEFDVKVHRLWNESLWRVK